MQSIQIGETSVPLLGFGTWQLKGDVARQAVTDALEVGYRHIDTADVYGNHLEVGSAIADAGLTREDLFITSKIWRTDFEPETLKESAHRFLDELQLDYLDLLLLHWPNTNFDHAAAVTAMNELAEEGIIKNYGVSNFTIQLLTELAETLPEGVAVTNNQVELHPSLYQKDLIEYCQTNDITVTAYSPIAQGKDLSLDEVVAIAKDHNCSEAQVVLAWFRHLNIIAIPRSATLDHIKDNFASQEVTLTDTEVATLSSLNSDLRIVHPDWAPF